MGFWRRIFGAPRRAYRPLAAQGPWLETHTQSSHRRDSAMPTGHVTCPVPAATDGEPVWFRILQAHAAAVQGNDRAVQLFREGQLDEAIATLQRTLKANPQYATGYSNLGFLYLCKGQLDQAASCLLRALEIDPRHPDAPEHLVDVLRGLIDEVVQIGFSEGFLTLYPDEHFDHHHRHRRVREIGKLITTIGTKGVIKVKGNPLQARQLRQLVMRRVQQQMYDPRYLVTLTLAWDGLDAISP